MGSSCRGTPWRERETDYGPSLCPAKCSSTLGERGERGRGGTRTRASLRRLLCLQEAVGARLSRRRLTKPVRDRVWSIDETWSDETVFRQCDETAIDETWFDETTKPGTRARWGGGCVLGCRAYEGQCSAETGEKGPGTGHGSVACWARQLPTPGSTLVIPNRYGRNGPSEARRRCGAKAESKRRGGGAERGRQGQPRTARWTNPAQSSSSPAPRTPPTPAAAASCAPSSGRW